MNDLQPPHDDRRVPPDAVVPPVRPGDPATLRPEHLYKAAGLLFLLAFLFRYLPVLVDVLLMAYASVILAVLFNALVRRVPMRRSWITVVLGIGVLGALVALLWFGVPVLLGQFRSLVARAPEFEAQLRGLEAWLRQSTGLNVQLVGPGAQRFLREAFLSGSGGSDLVSRAQGVVGVLLVPLLIIMGALYAVAMPNEQLLNPLMRMVPRDRRLAFRRIFQLLGQRLLGWLRGVLLGMLSVGVLSFALYALIGVPNALLLATIAALTEFIPLLGPWIGGGIATGVAFVDDPTKGMWTALAALAVQQVENNLILPWTMSQSARVHPFVTLFALVLFGSLFGFLGVLLAIPLVLLIATVVEVLWVERAIDTDRDRIAPVVRE